MLVDKPYFPAPECKFLRGNSYRFSVVDIGVSLPNKMIVSPLQNIFINRNVPFIVHNSYSCVNIYCSFDFEFYGFQSWIMSEILFPIY